VGVLFQNLRFALRSFRKSPVFVAVSVLSLALGIGANTAIFSLVDQVLLRLLPVKDPEQLVLLWGRGPHYGSNNGRYKLSYPMYTDFRDHNQVFSGMFCRWDTAFSVAADGKTERVYGEAVSGSYFPVLGVGAALGRVLGPDDDTTPDGHPFAVLSYRYWLTRFGGDPGVLGKKMLINGYPFTIVGVSQAGFDGLDPTSSPSIRVPVTMKHALDPQGFYDLISRRGRWVNTFGRLKPGVTREQAKAALQPYFHQMLEMEVQQKEFSHAAPETRQRFLTMFLDVLPASKGDSPLRDKFSSPLLVLTGIVATVLLIACANVANLLLARATGRQKEIAVRLALGASRMQIVSQLLVESLILALAGGAVGLALAVGIDRALIAFIPDRAGSVAISTSPDWRILAFSAAVSVLTGILFGLVPALQATRPDVAGTLKDLGGSIAGGTSVFLRKSLVAAQVTMSLLLLIGAGLFIRSLQNLKDLDPGFKTTNLVGFAVDPPLAGYTNERAFDFYRQLRENLDAMPGVDSAGLAIMPVLTGNEWDSTTAVEGYSYKSGYDVPDPHMNFVSPDYFKAMRIPILLGRDFRMTDDVKGPKVCIVNERFARKFFKDGNAVGRHIGMGGDPGTKLDIEIVGVVRDTKYESMRDEVPLEVYRPYQQMNFALGMYAYIRTARNPEQIFSSVRQVVSNLDPNLPVFQMKTIEAQMQESLVTERLVATLSAGFGLLATLLAAVGLYGVMAYLVAQRTKEIGLRMALGAASGDVVWLVMKEVLLLAGIGIGVGLPAAYALTRFVKSQLYGIQPTDITTVAVAIAGIAFVAIASGYLPARRATLVDPIRALRWE
jgi:predicted permease